MNNHERMDEWTNERQWCGEERGPALTTTQKCPIRAVKYRPDEAAYVVRRHVQWPIVHIAVLLGSFEEQVGNEEPTETQYAYIRSCHTMQW